MPPSHPPSPHTSHPHTPPIPTHLPSPHTPHPHIPRLPTLKKRREDHATDLEKFYDLVQKLEEHRSSLREKVEERTTELAERNSELDAAQGKIRTMKARIETQELTVDDVRRMDAERERAEEGAAAAARARADHAKGAWEGELEVRKAVERLREAAARYDELAGGLGLEGLVVDPGRAHEEGARGLLGGADLEGSVLASIRELKASYGERYSSAKQRMSALLDEEQACEEKRTECADRVKVSRFGSVGRGFTDGTLRMFFLCMRACVRMSSSFSKPTPPFPPRIRRERVPRSADFGGQGEESRGDPEAREGRAGGNPGGPPEGDRLHRDQDQLPPRPSGARGGHCQVPAAVHPARDAPAEEPGGARGPERGGSGRDQ